MQRHVGVWWVVVLVCSACVPGGMSAGRGPIPHGPVGAWQRVADLVYPVRAPSVATDGERIFVFGGSTRDNIRVAHTQIFDPRSGTWTLGREMPEAVEWSSAIYARGRVHVLGGVTNRRAAVPSHWIYDPGEDMWTTGPDLPVGAAGAAVGLIDGRIYLVGGIDRGPGAYSARVRVFDLESGRWSAGEDAPVANINWQAAVIDGAFWIAGGSGPVRVTSTTSYAYDPETDRWSSHPPLSRPNEGYGGAEVAGRYCLAGGRTTPARGSFSNPFDRVVCFLPSAAVWSVMPALPTAVEENGAIGLDGSLYVIGGRISFAGVTGEVHRMAF